MWTYNSSWSLSTISVNNHWPKWLEPQTSCSPTLCDLYKCKYVSVTAYLSFCVSPVINQRLVQSHCLPPFSVQYRKLSTLHASCSFFTVKSLQNPKSCSAGIFNYFSHNFSLVASLLCNSSAYIDSCFQMGDIPERLLPKISALLHQVFNRLCSYTTHLQ